MELIIIFNTASCGFKSEPFYPRNFLAMRVATVRHVTESATDAYLYIIHFQY